MLEEFLYHIKNPSEEFTPIPFWFFNDEPDEEKIKKQLMDYMDKGVNGIVLHPRIGIPNQIAYLSEAYFQAVKYIVKAAEEIGMKIVLYDEGMYPSGSAHGMVVSQNADYASKGITLSDSADGGEVITRFSDGRYLLYTFTCGTIRGIHFGEDDGEEGAPLSADILNPEAVDAFIRLTHERYYRELKEYFGSTVIAFFTDEPCPLGRNAERFREWASGMEGEIIENGGRLEDLEALFSGKENETTRIYHKLIKKHLREIYYARLSQWCASHGISLMGHPEASDDVEEEFYFQIPGQDLIMRRVAPENGGMEGIDSVQAKLAADIARCLNRKRNANECFGVCNRGNIPWYFTGYDMKWYMNWLGIRGVNLFVPHAFYYSIAGARKEERPPDVGPNNIWWRHYRMFSDYMKRISYLMTDSLSHADIAVLCDNNHVPAKEIAGLYTHQIAFHYLPVALLADCKMSGGRLCIGQCSFTTVVDLHGYRTKEAYAKYLADVRVVTGAESLYTEDAASRLCHEDGGFRILVTEHDCPDLRAVHMEKEGVSWYLLSNEGEETITTTLSVKEAQDAKMPFFINLWDMCAQDGGFAESRAAQGKVLDNQHGIRLKLEPCEMKLLLFLEENEMETAKKYCADFISAQELKEAFLGDWTDRFISADLECFAPCAMNENTACYYYAYDVPEEKIVTGREYFVVRGEEMAECICNGILAGVSFYTPHKFRIGHLLKGGKNEIYLRFTGNAANLYGTEKVAFGLDGY
ncbi:MAG: hypothetical protein NC321_01885 [Clostridium sp.]|nr:hypothetical protein [Clostridium sp.]